MKVVDLIEELQKLCPDDEVCILTFGYDGAPDLYEPVRKIYSQKVKGYETTLDSEYSDYYADWWNSRRKRRKNPANCKTEYDIVAIIG